MNIAVYCGANSGDDAAFTQEAEALGAWIAEAGHTLIWGAGAVGLMGSVSKAALDGGAHCHGVIPDFLTSEEIPFDSDFEGLLEVDIMPDMASRRLRMIELADAFVALPGGPGTLEELSEVMSIAKFDKLGRPVILMNVHGYYDSLIGAFDNMVKHQFITADVRTRLQVAENAAEVASLLG